MNVAALKTELAELVRRDRSLTLSGPPFSAARSRLDAQKWDCAARLLALSPFPTRTETARSAQWTDAVRRIRDCADLPELVDWALLQAEVARNREAGIPDMRPRKDGPCHALALEHARARARKAAVVVAWMDAAEAAGSDRQLTPSRVFMGRAGTDEAEPKK